MRTGINKFKEIVLKSGQTLKMKHDAMQCPCCLNSLLHLKSIVDNVLIMECDDCGCELRIPFVTYSYGMLDSNDIDYVTVDEDDYYDAGDNS